MWRVDVWRLAVFLGGGYENVHVIVSLKRFVFVL